MTQVYSPSLPLRWSWVSLVGPDAQDFLQRLTTVNTRELSVGQGAKGFFLTPQGKARAYFTLWNYGQGEYGFEFDAGIDDKWKSRLMEVIDQFTFGEKQTLTDVSAASALECVWVFPTEIPAGLPEPMNTSAVDGDIRVCNHGSRDFGKTWLSLWGKPDQLERFVEKNLFGKTCEKIEEKTFRAWRIEALRPWVDSEITEATIPLEAGLKDAIAEQKGCYPGQEVIERIIALGSPARRLALLHGSGTVPPAGTKLMNLAEPPQEIGTVTSSTRLNEQDPKQEYGALAFIKKLHAKEGLELRTSTGESATIVQVASDG